MGSVHNELRRGNLSAALTRALGVQKGDEGIERFGETMQPVIDLWSQPEFSFLRHELLMTVQFGNVAVAGEFSAVALVNPVASNCLAVVEMVDYRTPTASGGVTLRLASAAAVAATLTFTGKGTSRDFRSFASPVALGAGGGRIEYYIGSDPAAIGGILEDGNTPNTSDYRNFQTPPYILAPGQALVVQCGTVNNIILANARWRERAALPGELD